MILLFAMWFISSHLSQLTCKFCHRIRIIMHQNVLFCYMYTFLGVEFDFIECSWTHLLFHILVSLWPWRFRLKVELLLLLRFLQFFDVLLCFSFHPLHKIRVLKPLNHTNSGFWYFKESIFIKKKILFRLFLNLDFLF